MQEKYGWLIVKMVSFSVMQSRPHKFSLEMCDARKMNSTEVQNPRRKMQVALFAEPKTPLESSMSIIIL